MNERELKNLFCKALASGHILGKRVIPSPDVAELRVIEEANFRSFDLVVAAVTPRSSESRRDRAVKVLARPALFSQVGRQIRRGADQIQFFPVELKSDDDVIDERLPNQIVDAILTFGLSIIVLDKGHSERMQSSKMIRALPCTLISYTGREDFFEVSSVFDRFVSCGIFDFERMNLARLLEHASGNESARVHRRLQELQGILQKIVFAQLHFSDPGLMVGEQEFIRSLAGLALPERRRVFSKIIKETVNAKLTDFT